MAVTIREKLIKQKPYLHFNQCTIQLFLSLNSCRNWFVNSTPDAGPRGTGRVREDAGEHELEQGELLWRSIFVFQLKFATILWGGASATPWASYNVSAVKNYNATGNVVGFENKNIFVLHTLKSAIHSLLQRWRWSCKFRSRRIGS
jgi:hypothetical protein